MTTAHRALDVVVAMSGGVDSSVAAALLLKQGHNVTGITLQLWPRGAADQDRHHGCCSLDAVEDARRVASTLGIPYYVIDVQEEFQMRVVEPFLDDYQQGRTPNPCIACNDEVKFDLLLARARSIGADLLATGHYARVEEARGGGLRLLRAVDDTKDQSYVLYGLGQDELAGVTFPLGGWHKADVRARARDLGLVTADKPDSVEICFVAGGDYRDIVARRAATAAGPRGGEIRHIDGTHLGAHAGIWNFTVGQKSGLGALPKGLVGPLFVTHLDPATQTVTVGPRTALGRAHLRLGSLSFVAGAPPAPEFRAEVRVRYGATPVPAMVRIEDGVALLQPDEPFGVAAPGQAAVLYAGDEVLGGGRILGEASPAAPIDGRPAPVGAVA